MKKYYEILELTNKCSEADIKKSYYTLSLKNHPDKGGDTEKFQEISEAYEILSDVDKRKEYDNEYNKYHHQQQQQQQHNMNFNTRFGNNPNNIFDIFFSNNGIQIGHGFRNMNFKPTILIKIVTITFQEMYKGITKNIIIERTITNNNIQLIENESLNLSIEPGINNNSFTLLQNRGNVLNNIRGDLQIIIKIDNSSEYERIENNIIYKKNISLKEALCGFTFKLLYLNGNEIMITNREMGVVTKQNDKIILKNLGIKNADFIIEVNIEFPDTLTNDQINRISEILE